MKILITGAAGGIGSTLGHELFKLGHKLILVDSLRNGYEENLTIDGHSFGYFHKVDINSDIFHNIIENETPDVIIHLAAITSLPDCEVNYRECIRVNVEGTASVLGAASKYGVKRVIFGSTSAVYENTKLNSSGFKEDDDTNPRLFYSLSKKMAEELCVTYRENYGLDVLILRFFNVFGPRQDIHRKSPPVINYIVREMIKGESPILHSDGDQSRDYIYINDIISFIEKCLTKKTDSFIFNLSTQTLTSVKDIVDSVKKSNVKFESVSEVFRESDKLWDSYPELFAGKFPLRKEIIEKETNKKSLGDNSVSKRELDWNPSNNIKELIISTSIDIQNNKIK